MSDMIADGASFQAAMFKSHASKSVTYQRGALSTSLDATIGSSLLRITDKDGTSRTIRTDRDYTFTTADLILGGMAVLPKSGDVVIESFGGVLVKYELMPIPGEPSYRHVGPNHEMTTIHTKYTGLA